MTSLMQLLAVGWPEAAPSGAWDLQTHLVVAGTSLALWLLFLWAAERHHRNTARHHVRRAAHTRRPRPLRNVLAFRHSPTRSR